MVRVFIALLAERYAEEIRRPEARAIAEDAFKQGANRMLRQVLEPVVAWWMAEVIDELA